MAKKFIAAHAVLIFLLLLLCACGAEGGEKQPLAKTAVDSSGKKYSVIVDTDGFLTLGEKDLLAVCVEDENGNPGKNADGEFVTRAEEFPRTLVADGEIHTKFFRIKIPEGWTNKSDEIVRLVSDEATLTVNERDGYTVKECKKEIKSLLSVLGEGKEEKTALPFSDSVKITYDDKLAVYIFEAEGRVYFVKVAAEEKLSDAKEYEEIINTIKFRKGE